ncbi:MAG: hypothetical protein ACJZ18_03865 [Methylophilaceae bacterium]
MSQNNQIYIEAIDLALNGKWNEAHVIVQELSTPLAQRIHAVLHKIEGDESNSRYWYSLAGFTYEEFLNSTDELQAIKLSLSK